MLTIDTIAELIKDYVGLEELPADARPTKLMFKPTDNGKLAIELISDEWKAEQTPINVNFKIKRVYSV